MKPVKKKQSENYALVGWHRTRVDDIGGLTDAEIRNLARWISCHFIPENTAVVRHERES